jgi:hypothetical protein
MRDLRSKVKDLGLPVSFASENSMREKCKQYALMSEYFEGVELSGTGGPISCLIYTAHLADIVTRDIDALVANGEFYEWRFACDAGSASHIITGILANDWGGMSEKDTWHCVNCLDPCSPRRQSIFCTAIPGKIDESHKKISGSYENFEIELSKVQGLLDLNRNKVVRLGTKHALVPAHTLPSDPANWTVTTITTEDMPEFLANRYGRPGTPVETAAYRAGLSNQSATFIALGNDIIGIAADGLAATFPFRTPVSFDPARVTELIAGVVVFEFRNLICSDLLALSTLIGHPGQAGVTCQWHDTDACGFKRMAQSPFTIHCPLRTPASEAANLLKYEHKSGKKTPVNGVTRKPLFPFDNFWQILVPPLHILLGIVNFVMQAMYKVAT